MMLPRQIKAIASYSILGIVLLGVIALNLHKPMKTLTVALKPVDFTIYFSGVTSPIDTYNVLAPFDGIVREVKVLYGDAVKKGQVLFLIQSKQEEENLITSLETYVKARSAYQNSLFKNNGNEALFKSGLLSKLELLESQDQVESNKLGLWTSEQKLKTLLLKTGISISLFDNLTVDKIPTVEPILRRALEGVAVVSPEEGSVFFPSKAMGNTEDEAKNRIKRGSTVKLGQPLAVIANRNGIQLKIDILETNFHDIKKGDKVTITGIAFPDISLTGYVHSKNAQADNNDASSTPTYSAIIEVRNLTPKEQKQIEVGMSVQIAFTKQSAPQIRIPVDALIDKNGQYWVRKLLTKQNTIQEVPVIPGTTDELSVEIKQGLVAGDTIVLPN